MTDFLVSLALWLAIPITLALYLMPALIAHARRHPQRAAITVLNIAAGWLLLGWIAALVWAHIEPARPTVYHPANQP